MSFWLALPVTQSEICMSAPAVVLVTVRQRPEAAFLKTKEPVAASG